MENPVRYRKIGCIPDEAKDFYRIQYGDHSYDGFLYAQNKQMNGMFKTMRAFHIKDSGDFVDNMYVLKSHDYYITANTFLYPTNRSQDSLFSLNNIVIDIDCHRAEDGNTLREKCANIERVLFSEIIMDEILPMPNHFVFTGRGVHLWWSLIPTHVKNPNADTGIIAIYKSVIQNWCKIIENELSLFEEFREFHIDTGASINAAGVFRMPGTINKEVNRTVTVHCCCENHYDLYELIDRNYNTGVNILRHRNTSPRQLSKNEKSAVPSIPYNMSDIDMIKDLKTHPVAYRRVAALIALRTIRDAAPGDERRDLFCFLMYNALCFGGLEDDDAMERTLQFNRGFKVPLNEHELISYLSTSRRKGYRITNKYIIDVLSISPEEQQLIKLTSGKHLCTSKEGMKRAAKEIKTARMGYVVALYLVGKQKAEIIRTTGVSAPTVNKYIQMYENGRLDEDLKETIAMYQHKLTTDKI